MTDANTPDTSGQESKNTATPSEAQIILGPLLKYALMGLVLAALLLTTVVMLGHRITDINREVAALEAELIAERNDDTATSDTTIPPVGQTSYSTSSATEVVTNPQQFAAEDETAASETPAPSSKDAIADLEESTDAIVSAPLETGETVARALQNKRVTSPTIPQSVESAIDANTIATASEASDRRQPALYSRPLVRFSQNERLPDEQTLEAIITESNAYLRRRDDVYLEDYKASQEKQLQFMRDRLARQQQRIKDREALYQQRYDLRADNLKELQKIRESFVPDRI